MSYSKNESYEDIMKKKFDPIVAGDGKLFELKKLVSLSNKTGDYTKAINYAKNMYENNMDIVNLAYLTRVYALSYFRNGNQQDGQYAEIGYKRLQNFPYNDENEIDAFNKAFNEKQLINCVSVEKKFDKAIKITEGKETNLPTTPSNYHNNGRLHLSLSQALSATSNSFESGSKIQKF